MKTLWIRGKNYLPVYLPRGWPVLIAEQVDTQLLVPCNTERGGAINLPAEKRGSRNFQHGYS